jgi:hypothetical protein
MNELQTRNQSHLWNARNRGMVGMAERSESELGTSETLDGNCNCC